MNSKCRKSFAITEVPNWDKICHALCVLATSYYSVQEDTPVVNTNAYHYAESYKTDKIEIFLVFALAVTPPILLGFATTFLYTFSFYYHCIAVAALFDAFFTLMLTFYVFRTLFILPEIKIKTEGIENKTEGLEITFYCPCPGRIVGTVEKSVSV